MFDGPNTLRKFETDAQSNISVGGFGCQVENAGFLDSNEAYQQLKKEAMEKIFKAAPKHLRARLTSGDF
ncbi:MAG: hypothetical protein QGH73_12820 [Rhodospirillales bacterium]|jgi:hypothetical protein|nr:hypothetical protein [Rhodospirillaceae bacterium]MDP6427529.1 hypothetical protein [Rhodospirillales bacterium]MDP6646289.1 hypothetical protein [Rhodospirillales bacterium]MDP6842554.1 hypothetical protein [Rhodospirillales bacterium]|tara:strand:+ start:2576 stop:2782 length:207 start_codon:yes stop_codon:yes gene_type:complete